MNAIWDSYVHSGILKPKNRSRTQSYPTLLMFSQQGMSPDQRYLENIGNEKKQKEDSIGVERAERQYKIDRLARGALPVPKKIHKHSPAPQTSQSSQGVGGKDGRIISELDSGSWTPEASRPSALPSPPISPVISNTPTEMVPAAALASTVDSHGIAHLHAALQDHLRQIRSLTLELEGTQIEVQSLRKERREASKEHLRAVCGNAEEEIEKHKIRVERLVRMVEEKEQTIEGLERRIEEGRGRERELRGRLVEAERRTEEAEKRPSEAESCFSGGGRPWEEGKPNGKSKGVGKKRGGARAGNIDWEFRRRKGEKQTSVGAMYQVLVRGTP
ncbi:MAG: hypothetical protein Q9168_007343 [Polycauliona sp. 1 TL-2023]